MNLAAIILAAGSGSRFGGDKLHATFKGQPLITHAIKAAYAAPVRRVIVIGPHSHPNVETLPITSTSLSDTLKAGIAAVQDCDGAFVFLGDMPLIPKGIAQQLAEALGENFAAVPRFNSQQGHPVLLSARAFTEIAHLTGDHGAGKLLRGRDDIAFVDCPNGAILMDVDRAADIARLEDLA